jgi:hypothetical protein
MVKIQALLDRMKSTPIDMKILKTKLPSYCNILQYKELANKHRSDLFQKYDCIVVFIPSKTAQVGHFILLSARDRYISYFSSLGGSPTQELKRLGQDDSIMMNILGKHFTYNSKPLQSSAKNVQDCAPWIIARSYLNHLKLKDFQKLFSHSVHLQTPDDMVTFMTLLIFSDL